MTRKKRTVIIICSITAAIILIWFLFFRKKTTTVVLQTEKPQFGYIAETVTATGTIQPADTVAVGTQISGTIYRLYADMNDNVRAGELLAEIDPTLIQAQLDQARAVLAQNQSNLALQEKNFNRQRQLYNVGAISKADYDAALNSLNAAKAQVQNAQAQVKSASKNLSLTKIYSPINGVVLTRNVSVGQTVAASFSTPTLFSIAKDLTDMQVKTSVDEADVGNLVTGLRTTFTVDAYLNDVFEGSVNKISLQPTITSNVVTYSTYISTKNPGKKLKPGMTANVTIYTRETNHALLIPVKAIKFRPDSSLQKQYKLVYAPRHKRTDSAGWNSGNDSAGSARSGGAGRHGRDSSASKGTWGGGGVRGNVKMNGEPEMQTDNTRASVWVLKGDALIQKRIRTGLNNNTQVQVLDGLTVDDMVVTGATGGETKSGGGQGSSASPFMPQRRGRGGAGGGRGGGGGGPRQ